MKKNIYQLYQICLMARTRKISDNRYLFEDEEKMRTMYKIYNVIMELWGLYWKGQNNEEINDAFENAATTVWRCRHMDVSRLSGPGKNWKMFKETFDKTALMKLGPQTKKMTAEQRIETNLLFSQLWNLYCKYD